MGGLRARRAVLGRRLSIVYAGLGRVTGNGGGEQLAAVGPADAHQFRCGRAIPLALAALATEWVEHLKPLGRFRRVFELAGSVLLMLTGLYLLNGYFAFFP